jgi:uncharacterized membrane protein
MKELIWVTLYWLHLLATVTWIGGIIFILLVAIPSAKEILEADASKMMGAITKRFAPLANYSILLLVITGIAITGWSKEFSESGNLNINWVVVLTLKHVLVLAMIAIHFYRGLILGSKIERATSPAEKSLLQRLSLNLVKVNFALGAGILLLSGVTSIV